MECKCKLNQGYLGCEKVIAVNITPVIVTVIVTETILFEKTNMHVLGNYLGIIYIHLLHFPLFSWSRVCNAKAREKGKLPLTNIGFNQILNVWSQL